MFLSIKHYPEIARHVNSERMLRITRKHLQKPKSFWLIDTSVFLLLIYTCFFIELSQSLSFLTRLAALVISFVVVKQFIKLWSINTWQRQQFLAVLASLTKQANQSEIAYQQANFNQLWRDSQVNKRYRVRLDMPVTQPLLEFGFIGLTASDEKAMIRWFDKNENGIPTEREIIIQILNEAIVPAHFSAGLAVRLTLSERPITAKITEVLNDPNKSEPEYSLESAVPFEEQAVQLPYGQLMHIVRFACAPEVLPMVANIKAMQHSDVYQAELVHCFEPQLVALKIAIKPAQRQLLCGDQLRLTFGDTVLSQLEIVSICAPFIKPRYAEY
ncbi:hypothetical protein PULV_b0624 [Pseudoalteromonas ulvae UL12]|uniref:hypothetical protein n=1 Tax=Pseudoalteromonas ulvae TaxID=107327 RepID=UPI00186B885C|nr:hypothetical protein [Pseudoalteromonas ulvae]MBE0365922.1 hypothetical protein [Pseudoalteromonas ulvae UL12]